MFKLHSSHTTLIATVREAMSEWRKRYDWSRETAVQKLVEKHREIGAESVTGIRFDTQTEDVFIKTKVNADKVFRWLDDVTKDSGTMPMNFFPTVLAALPEDLRLRLLSDMVRPYGLAVHTIEDSVEQINLGAHLCALLKEDAEAHQAVAVLIESHAHADLLNAHQQVTEAIAASQRVAAALEAQIAKNPNVVPMKGAA